MECCRLFAIWGILLAITRQAHRADECSASSPKQYRIPSDKGINLILALHSTEYVSGRNLHLLRSISHGFLQNMSKVYTLGDKRYFSLCVVLFDESIKFAKIPSTVRNQASVINEILQGNLPPDITLVKTDSTELVERIFSEGHKSYAPNVCMLLLASPINTQQQIRNTAQNLQSSGISVIVVAIGNDVSIGDVADLASNRNVVFAVGQRVSDENIQQHEDDAVTNITSALKQGHVLPSFRYCHNAYVSFFIIIDVSQDHIQTLYELREFVSKFSLGRVSMMVIIINSPVSNDWYMRSFHSLFADVYDLKIQTYESAYNLSSSINRGRKVLLNYGALDKRKFQEKIIVVVTDKTPLYMDDVISKTRLCKIYGVNVMVLGVGESVSRYQLSLMCTDPRSVVVVNTTAEISYGLERLNRLICPRICEAEVWSRNHDGMCYFLYNQVQSFDSAELKCAKTMSKPASITNKTIWHWFRNESFITGLRRKLLNSGQIGLELRWESGKPYIFTKWNNSFTFTYTPGKGCNYSLWAPEDVTEIVRPCFLSTPCGWREFSCGLGPENYDIVSFSNVLCEKEAGNRVKRVHTVKMLPLWEENSCPLPSDYSNHTTEFIVVTGDGCRPVFDVHVKVDLRGFFSCSNGELISKYLQCDGLGHCLDGSDEMNCSLGCSEDQFSCDNGRCVSLAYFCDFWDDCGDNSDETGCATEPHSAIDQWQCDSGQYIRGDARCDLYIDCYDKSDEKACFGMCSDELCFDDLCLPWHWIQDDIADTVTGSDENENCSERVDRCYTGRYRELFHLFANPVYKDVIPDCCMVHDGFGKQLKSPCKSDDVTCPIGFYRCPSSYCIPIERVCDGVMDCIDGEEEQGCGNYECPGYFRCPFTTYCHHPARVCDGDADCPGGRDEVMCDFICPDNCSCSAGFVECNHVIMDNTTLLDGRTRKLVIIQAPILDSVHILKNMFFVREVALIGSNLISMEDMLSDLINLRILNVSQNLLYEIPSYVFMEQGSLKTLDVSNNPINNISTESFYGLHTLEELFIKDAALETLERECFSFLRNLKVLDIRRNKIQSISDGAFTGLKQLISLNVLGNPNFIFGEHIYADLNELREMYTDLYSICCPQVRPAHLSKQNCVSPIETISSCHDLLANNFLRTSIWLLCIAALFGNFVTIVTRFAWERNTMKNGFGVFVTHLGISDFLMGVYLLIIAIADIRFKGIYLWNDYTWRQSCYCRLAGALATISSEASTFFICLITLDRFLIIRFPFGQFKFRQRSATSSAIIAWILAVAIAVFPLIPSLYHWNFYSKNGVCLPLRFSKDRKPGWIYTAIIFIGVNFATFLVIALGQISIYRAMKQSSVVTSQKRNAQDMAVARRLFVIVASDFFCWFPVGVMTVLALSGRPINEEVYAWTAVFILPVNSALNPFLYTIPSVVQKLKHRMKEKTSAKTELVTKSSREHVVMVGDPAADLVLLKDVLLHIETKEERFKLILDVLEKVKSYLQNATQVPHHLNAIYVGMRGKVVDRICLTTTADVLHVDPVMQCARLVMEQGNQPKEEGGQVTSSVK